MVDVEQISNSFSTVKIKDIFRMFADVRRIKKYISNNRLALITFAIVYLYIFYILRPSLLLMDTTIAGGDTGSHNYIVCYLKEIFPSIHSWSHDWYGGFPFLYFYPPFLYILAVILSYAIPINIAFKLITILGTLLLPISSFLCLRLLKLKDPVPHIGAVFSLSFIFLEAYNIYGGNLPSTLAGEFSYSFSFSLFWIFIASMKRGLEENKYLFINIAVLSLIALSHPIPVISSILLLPVFLYAQDFRRRFIYIVKVYAIAFVITSFWSLPFLWYLDYTSIMKWWRLIKPSDIFPISIIPLQILAVAGIVYSLLNKEKSITILLFIAVANLIPYFLLNDSKIWNTRFLPFFTMGFILIAAYFTGSVLSKIPSKSQLYLILPILALTLIVWIDRKLTYIPHWIKWNYEGFEKKTSWKEIKPLFDYLKTLPHGRVMWEYRAEYDRFGTTRILELIPLFSKQPTVEGLLIESAISSPFHFINQAETTKTPTHAVRGIKYPEFNFNKWVEHLKLFGIRYFVAYTKEAKDEAEKLIPKLKDIGPFSVYEIQHSRIIIPLTDFDVRIKTKNWLSESVDWYKTGDLSKPIIFTKNSETRLFRKTEFNQDIKIAVTRFEKNTIHFNTNATGIPHMIKTSYFPRWRVKGADGPFLVSPAFMVVIPNSNNVELIFR